MSIPESQPTFPYKQLFLCFIGSALLTLYSEKAQAITIATADPYDATTDAKSKAIAEDARISDELAPAAVPKQMNDYYTQRGKVPPYSKALQQLAAPDVHQQQQASEYLRALLARSLADDEAGATQWDTGYWSTNYPSAARWLRERIVHYLTFENEPPPGALPVLRWYLDAKVMPTFQETAMSVLGKLKTSEADALRLQVVSRPQPNATVVVAALQQLQADKTKIPADKLLTLCQDHRLKGARSGPRYQQRTGRP